MSEFKGTPGPWVAEGDGCVRHSIPCGFNTFNQSIKLGSGWIEGAYTDGDADEETLANARLIAAAPDLLEALEKTLFALEVADTCLKTWNEVGAPVNVEGISFTARAAIAKALQS